MTREEAIKRLEFLKGVYSVDTETAIDMAIEALSERNIARDIATILENEQDMRVMLQNDAVQGWRIGKPTEQGKYMVTIDSFGHKRIDLFYYGKPMMPNRKVRGKCWYRSDDEWGDVVYDDTDILAWQPLPKPYGERREE